MEQAPDRTLRLRAPAKVNLILEVVGRRPDGYHELRMLMAPVSLFDELTIEATDDTAEIQVSCEGAAAVEGGESNLCYRAARYYLAEAGVSGGARIRVRKSIPAGAGLGGGSSDAAVTILGLEHLFSRPLSAEQRTRTAFEVGADVPFFFARSVAWVEGIGERLKPVSEAAPQWLVLVCPNAFVSTTRVFSGLNRGLTSPRPLHTITQFNFRGLAPELRNDLQEIAVALEPQVSEALQALRVAGAPAALMTGSGSAVFGLFPDEPAARRAAEALEERTRTRQWGVKVVHTLPPGAFPFLSV